MTLAAPSLAPLSGFRSFAPFLSQIHEIRTDPVAVARRYWSDVAGWAMEFIDWGAEVPSFAPYQVESWRALLSPPSPEFRNRVCVRGPRGSGKSFSQAMQLLHFATTREGSGTPWTIVTTAGSIGQLKRYLWPEVHKWARRIRWERLGLPEWRLGRELGLMHIHATHGNADYAAPVNEALIEGAHNNELLFLFDESKAIPTKTWDACEGAFFNAGARGQHGYWRADSTPGNASGRFFEIHRRKRGLEDWWTRHVKPEEAIAAGLLNATIPAKMLELWGPGSRMYRNHVLAEFADSASDRAVIPLEWVESAIERGYEWLESVVPETALPPDLGRTERTKRWWELAAQYLPALSQIGVDVGSGGPGRDPAAIAARHDFIIAPIEVLECSEVELAGKVIARHKPGAKVVPDSIDAATLVERLKRTYGLNVVPCNSSLPSDKRDRTGELAFLNVRTELWWGGRERLDPSQNPTLVLPDDPTLVGELTEPEWEETAGGKVKVEDKKQVGKRVRRQAGREDEGGSTNRADAALMACWGGSATGGPARAITPRAQPGMGF